MTVTTAIAANAVKNDGATVLKAGNVSSTATHVTNATTLMSNAVKHGTNSPQLAVSTIASGNIGAMKAYSAGTFAYSPPNHVSSSTPVTIIARRVSTTISGVSNTALQSGGSATSSRRAINPSAGDRTYGNTYGEGATFDLFTGALTKGTGHGTFVLNSGIDGTNKGMLADHAIKYNTFAVPGELVLMETGKTPTQKDYAAKYSL